MAFRQCTKCGKAKTENETNFRLRPNTKAGWFGHCRECLKLQAREYQRKWRKTKTGCDYHRLYNKRVSVKTQKRKWQLKNKDSMRNTRYQEMYGIGLETYNRLFTTQGGRCAICGRHQIEFKSKLCVDHDHKTNKVRGLLCRACNGGLGFVENENFVQNARNYLMEIIIKEESNVPQ